MKRIVIITVIICLVLLLIPSVAAADLNIVGHFKEGSVFAIVERAGYLYVGNGGTVYIYDVSTPAKQLALHQNMSEQPLDYHKEISNSITVDALIQGLEINGTLLLVTSSDEAVLVDITTPAAPVELSRFTDPFTGSFDRATIVGNYAYISETVKGVLTYDITNPALPVYMGFVKGVRSPYDQTVMDGYLYTGSMAYTGFSVYSLANPAAPTFVREFNVSTGTHSAYGITSKNNTVYLSEYASSYDGGLWTIDVTNPANPVTTDHYHGGVFTTRISAKPTDLHIDGNYLYQAVRYYGYVAYDINTDKQHPISVEEYFYSTTGITDSGYSEGIYHSSDAVYLALDTYGFGVVDDTVVTAPTFVAHFSTPCAPDSIEIVGDTAFIGGHNVGIWAIDVSNKASPVMDGFVFSGGRVQGLDNDGTYLYSTASWATQSIFKISGIPSIETTSYQYKGWPGAGNIVGNIISGNYLYNSQGVINVTDRYNPAWISNYTFTTTGRLSSGEGAAEFAFAGTTLVASVNFPTGAGEMKGVHFINVADKNHITNYSVWGYGQRHSSIAVKGTTVIIQNLDTKHIEFVDISDPYNPALLSYIIPYSSGGTAMGCYDMVLDTIDTTRLYVGACTVNPYIQQYNITNLSAPVLMESLTIPFSQSPEDTTYSNGYLYIGNYRDGLYIVSTNSTPPIVPPPIVVPPIVPPLLPQPTPIPRPNAWINPYAYEMPYYDQGTTGTCTGAAGAYVLGILRKQAEGAQPTYVEPSVIRDQTTTYEGLSITYDILPSWYLSSRSIYAAYNANSTATSNTTELAQTLMLGTNLEADWITPKNTANTTQYTPQTQAYLSTHRVWQTHGYSVYDGGESTPSELHTSAEKWEFLKEGIYRNGVGAVVIPVYSNYTMSNGTFFPEPTGVHIDHHWLAAVGYNDTQNVIYIMNSWAGTHPAHGKIEALTYNYWTYAAADGGKPNATIFRW